MTTGSKQNICPTEVRIVGGDSSEESKENLGKLLSYLQEIGGGNCIIDIKTCDTCERLHPDSFEVDGYHGGIRKLTSFIHIP